MTLFWTVLALLLLIEGAGPLLFPNKWRSFIQQLSAQDTQVLRRIGGVMVVSGCVILLWLNKAI